MQTIYKTASLGISELSGKVRYTQEHRKLATLKAQRAEFEAWSQANNKYHVSGYNPHNDLWEAWQAARRAPAVLVPQETCVICGSGEPYTGLAGAMPPLALCKKPAPQPTKAAQLDDKECEK